MAWEWTTKVKTLLIETAHDLKGASRRLFMARTVDAAGRGGQNQAHKELGWDPRTIRKGLHELRSGLCCVDAFNMRGRKPIENQLPELSKDLEDIVKSQSQSDPRFETCRLYRRITVKEVVKQLIENKGYSPEELPSNETIRKKLNKMGYRPNRVLKSKPKKKYLKPTKFSSGITKSTVRPMKDQMSFVRH